MLSKDHLRNVYQDASLNKNTLVMEKITCIWAHRFGVYSLNELKLQKQVLSNNELENKKELFIPAIKENDQSEKKIISEIKTLENIEVKNNKTIITEKSDSLTKKNIYIKDHLPLPFIKNLRKWINKDKKAS